MFLSRVFLSSVVHVLMQNSAVFVNKQFVECLWLNSRALIRLVFDCFVERICWPVHSVRLEIGGLFFYLCVVFFSQEDKSFYIAHNPLHHIRHLLITPNVHELELNFTISLKPQTIKALGFGEFQASFLCFLSFWQVKRNCI